MNFTTFVLQVRNYPANLGKGGGNKKNKYSKLEELKRGKPMVVSSL